MTLFKRFVFRLVVHVVATGGKERKENCQNRPLYSDSVSMPTRARTGKGAFSVCSHSGTSTTVFAPVFCRNSEVPSKSNFSSLDSMQRKKASRVACSNLSILKSGWYGVGSPF